MSDHWNTLASRRRFLRFVAGSPLVALAGSADNLFETRPTRGARPAPAVPAPDNLTQDPHVITSPGEALNVLEFEPVARKNLPPAHYGHLATGVDDDATLRANREGFAKFQLRARRLVDVSHLDASVQLFGKTWETPIVLAPTSGQKAFHPTGELGVARAARSKRHLQILSTNTLTPVEAVNEARGEPVWYQLYPTSDWSVTRAIVKRVEAAGCRVVVLTVDLRGITNRETSLKSRRGDTRRCADCHTEGFSFPGRVRQMPMFDRLDLSRGVDIYPPLSLTPTYLKRLKDTTSMKLVVKGLVTAEDTAVALEQGVDGIIVSNHGGRAEDSGRSTIESLAEVLEAARGRVPVLVDGGFRRGTDILKAMALGASAICIGRPYLWGLAAFGQAGVEAVLDILRRELQIIMRQVGLPTLADITQMRVVERVK